MHKEKKKLEFYVFLVFIVFLWNTPIAERHQIHKRSHRHACTMPAMLFTSHSLPSSAVPVESLLHNTDTDWGNIKIQDTHWHTHTTTSSWLSFQVNKNIIIINRGRKKPNSFFFSCTFGGDAEGVSCIKWNHNIRYETEEKNLEEESSGNEEETAKNVGYCSTIQFGLDKTALKCTMKYAK